MKHNKYYLVEDSKMYFKELHRLDKDFSFVRFSEETSYGVCPKSNPLYQSELKTPICPYTQMPCTNRQHCILHSLYHEGTFHVRVPLLKGLIEVGE